MPDNQKQFMPSTSPAKVRRLRSRITDYVLYIAIAFALVFFTILSSKWSHEAFIRWGGLVFFTSCLFGYFIQESRKFLRSWLFWKTTLILLVPHLLLFAAILTVVKEWRLPWFVSMALEYPILLFYRDRLPIS